MSSAFPRVRTLPEELVSAILAPHLSIPLNRFNDTSSKSPFNAPDHLSTSVILVVCKQWLRVATPLLYNTVIIRSKRQAASIKKAIKVNPSLGKFIKRLRLEGPYATTLENIVRVSPGISDLCLCFEVVPQHEGFELAWMNTMVWALNSINPISLNINVVPASSKATYWHKPCPRGPMNAIDMLESGIIALLSRWTNLVTVRVNLDNIRCTTHGKTCQDRCNTQRRDFVIALGSARSVRTVHLGFVADYPPPLLSQIISMISKNPSIQKIDLHPGTCSYKYPAHPTGSDVLRLDTILHVNGRSLQEPCTEAVLSPVVLSPSACAAASRFDNLIWRRIIEHAIVQSLWPTHTTFSLIQVCKRFQELGIPFLYKLPTFSGVKSFNQFVSRIHDEPSLRPHVESIVFPATLGPGLYTMIVTAENMMAATFRLLPGIKVLDSYDTNTLRLQWEAFEAICETSAENMTSFRPSVILKPTEERLVCITMFQPFRNLTVLRWDSIVGFDVGDEGRQVPSDILPSLEVLEYIHKFVQMPTRSSIRAPSLLGALCQIELPAIRTLLLKGDSCPDAAGFLKRHGAKIKVLEFDTHTEKPGALLQCCSSLTSLTIIGDVGAWSKEYKAMFKACSFDAHPLKKISISPDTWARSGEGPVSLKELQPWTLALSPAVYRGFPALREIEVVRCRWPQTESEMKTNHWPKISAKLMTGNIKLFGRDGRCWVPRMGDTTSMVRKK